MALTWHSWSTEDALLQQLKVVAELKRAVRNRAQLIGVAPHSSIPAESNPSDSWFSDPSHDPLTAGGDYWPRTVIARWLKDCRLTLQGLVAEPVFEAQNHYTDADWTNYSGVGSVAAGGLDYSAADLDWPQNWYGAVNHFREIVEALEWFEVYHVHDGIQGATVDTEPASIYDEPFHEYTDRTSIPLIPIYFENFRYGASYFREASNSYYEPNPPDPPYYEYLWGYGGSRIQPGGYPVYGVQSSLHKLRNTSIGTSIVVESKLWWYGAGEYSINAEYTKSVQDASGGFPGTLTPQILKVTSIDYENPEYIFTGDEIYSIEIKDGDFSPVYNQYGTLTGYDFTDTLSHIDITELVPALGTVYIGFQIDDGITANMFADFMPIPPGIVDGGRITSVFMAENVSYMTIRTRAQGPLPDNF